MGTEMISFSVKGQGAIEFPDFESLDVFTFSAEEEQEDKPSLIDQVKNIFSKQKRETADNIEDVSKAVLFLTQQLEELSNKIDKSDRTSEDYSKLSKELSDLKQSFTDQLQKLSVTPEGDHIDRPDADGGSEYQTNC
jgi:uncharacterized protein YpuA (DUF1002 family)